MILILLCDIPIRRMGSVLGDAVLAGTVLCWRVLCCAVPCRAAV
ncbi:hypothetical protein [Glaciimonas sp. PAMC28666]|nr:hypothetical protein [Glaciimonas sp. PAMC28666]